MMKPKAVVEHEAQEILFRALCGVAVAAHAAAVFATDVAGQRERHLVQPAVFRPIEILDFDAVVAVVSDAAWIAEDFLAQHVLIAQDGEPSVWPPQNLETNAGAIVESTVR